MYAKTQLLSQVLDARGAKVSADCEALGSLPHKVSWNNVQAHSSAGLDHERGAVQDILPASTQPDRQIQGVFDRNSTMTSS